MCQSFETEGTVAHSDKSKYSHVAGTQRASRHVAGQSRGAAGARPVGLGRLCHQCAPFTLHAKSLMEI